MCTVQYLAHKLFNAYLQYVKLKVENFKIYWCQYKQHCFEMINIVFVIYDIRRFDVSKIVLTSPGKEHGGIWRLLDEVVLRRRKIFLVHFALFFY